MTKQTWNHRIVKKEDWYGIYEVYYENDKVWTCTEEAKSVGGESLEDLKEYYKMMASAFEQPILNWEDIG